MARLAMSGVRKAFGSTVALDGVDLSVEPGEVHALIGENGAGKSTLMKILSGALAPDLGTIELGGAPFRPNDPLHARRAGIAMIHQELVLAPSLSVEANIVLGREPAGAGWLLGGAARRLARDALQRIGRADIPLDALVGTLSLADRQVVEIARALVGNPTVMVMDEATSALGPVDAERLFGVVAQLKALGVAVVYISHFLEECRRVCDRYTVLRDGKTVGTGAMRDATLPDLVRSMVGRDVTTLYPRAARTLGDVVLRVDRLRGRRAPVDVSFEVRRGEIFGVAGLVGAGRTETLRAVFGLDPLVDGRVEVRTRDEPVTSISTVSTASKRACSPRQRLGEGVAFASEDRKHDGLLLARSVADNVTMTRFGQIARLGFISSRRQRAAVQRQVDALGLKARPEQVVGELSGGNQQKVAFARLLHHDAEILLLDEPTRGIDVGAKADIYRLMVELASRGKAIVFVSSYLPELMGVCDTIGVMCRGRMAAIRPVSEWTEHDAMTAALQFAERAS
jgi:ribose transport system ATP-binding protein